MTVIHLKKKDVVKSKVRGIEMEFDHEMLATILGVPGTNGICEYIKDNVVPGFGKRDTSKLLRSHIHGPLDVREKVCKLSRENGIWWIGSGENRRRDDDVDALEDEAEEEDEGNKDDFDWEAVIDEATVEGNAGRVKGFMMLEDEARGSQDMHDEIPATDTHG
ncbi:hypothetical protein Dimus_001506 [Dionaea muscipula]